MASKPFSSKCKSVKVTSELIETNEDKISTSNLNSVKIIPSSQSDATTIQMQAKSEESNERNLADDSKVNNSKDSDFHNSPSIDNSDNLNSSDSKLHQPQFYGFNYDTLKHAGVYEPFILSRIKKERSLSNVVPLPPRCIGGLRDQIQNVKQCNCKKSNCLKLYCECFGNGIYCNINCKCTRCKNNDKHSELRSKVIQETLERNPNAFRPRAVAIAAAAASQPQYETMNNFHSSYHSRVTPPNSKNNLKHGTQFSSPPQRLPCGGQNKIADIPTDGKSSMNENITNYKNPTKTFKENIVQTQKKSGITHAQSDTYQADRKFKGCNCKKSFCLKKYCDCFQAGIYCSPSYCHCKNCKNYKGNREREALIAKRTNNTKAKAVSTTVLPFDDRGSSSTLKVVTDVVNNGNTQQPLFSNPYQTHASSRSFENSQNKRNNPAAAVCDLDMHLPPSSYTTPLQMGGIQISALSFETRRSQNVGDNRTTSRRLNKNTKADSIAKRKRYLSGLFKPETDLERIWREASEDIGEIGNAISVEVQRLLRESDESIESLKDNNSQIYSKVDKHAYSNGEQHRQKTVQGNKTLGKRVVHGETNETSKRAKVPAKSLEIQQNDSSTSSITTIAQTVIDEFKGLIQFCKNQGIERDLFQPKTEVNNSSTISNSTNNTTTSNLFDQSKISVSTKNDEKNLEEDLNIVDEDDILCKENIGSIFGEYNESEDLHLYGSGTMYSSALQDTLLMYETARLARMKALRLAAKRK